MTVLLFGHLLIFQECQVLCSSLSPCDILVDENAVTSFLTRINSPKALGTEWCFMVVFLLHLFLNCQLFPKLRKTPIIIPVQKKSRMQKNEVQANCFESYSFQVLGKGCVQSVNAPLVDAACLTVHGSKLILQLDSRVNTFLFCSCPSRLILHLLLRLLLAKS